MVRRVVRIFFLFLMAWQLTTAAINIVVERWDWVVFDLMCAAIVAVSAVVSDRNITSVKMLSDGRWEKVQYYREMLKTTRATRMASGTHYRCWPSGVTMTANEPCPAYARDATPCDHICDLQPGHRGHHHCPICHRTWADE